ncbi:MAG: (2Fe-2S)-binding protein [Deltaproteobacteria bacterium]|nr:(2Fe-2S)-binding protein [Deltaproteobacteria bacterium]
MTKVQVNDEDLDKSLLSFLRENLFLTGAKDGCGRGLCGACTVLAGTRAVRSCITPVRKVANKRILTIEGLAGEKDMHPLQKAFLEHGAVQCGFCTPGMIMSSLALLLKNPAPGPDEVKKALKGNLCRCTGYQPIVESVLAAAEEIRNKNIEIIGGRPKAGRETNRR